MLWRFFRFSQIQRPGGKILDCYIIFGNFSEFLTPMLILGLRSYRNGRFKGKRVQCVLHGLRCIMFIYRISANNFRGNYSFFNLTLCTVTFSHSTYRCGNYSREESIQGRKLFAEIRYLIWKSWLPPLLPKFFALLANTQNLYIKVAWPSNLKIWCKCAFVHAGERPSHLT